MSIHIPRHLDRKELDAKQRCHIVFESPYITRVLHIEFTPIIFSTYQLGISVSVNYTEYNRARKHGLCDICVGHLDTSMDLKYLIRILENNHME